MNNTILSVTFTGADEKTDLDAVANVDAEIGILYSANPESRNRYPRKEWITEAVKSLPRASLHVCGRKARANLLSDTTIAEGFQRIQVNGKVEPQELVSIGEMYPKHRIITQYVDRPNHNMPLLELQLPNHELLIDASGGRGTLPKSWNPPKTYKRIGYAGGLGPDNIKEQLDLIFPVASFDFWIDMETSVRVDDWFSIDKINQCLQNINEYIEDRYGFQTGR